MAQVLVTEQHLENIADSIREKTGTQSQYTPVQMAAAIGSIQSVGELSFISQIFSQNGSYMPSSYSADAFSGVIVDVPNTYDASDEGKVVSSGTLVSQGSSTISENGVYDTTLFSQIIASISGSGGGGNNDNYLIAIGASSGTINDSELSVIPSYAFTSRNTNNGQPITGFIGDNVHEIKYAAFYWCNDLNNISFPSCENIGSYAFASCFSLSEVNFPECLTIGSSAFYSCINLQTASFPKCITIGNLAFGNCSKLKTVSLPTVERIGSSAFMSCKSLETITLPNCTRIDTQAFQSCNNLSNVYIQSVSQILQSAFQYCSSLKTVWANSCNSMSMYAFYGCRALESIYLLNSSVTYLVNSNVFVNTPMAASSFIGYFGSIFVPSSLVASYKTDAKWSYYSDRITSYVEE